MVARIRLLVRRRTDADALVSEVCHTLVVNAHGALVALTMNVQTGEILALKNFNSAEEQDGRVLRVEENEGSSGKEVAFEFVNPAPHFWKIDFPPADWKALAE